MKNNMIFTFLKFQHNSSCIFVDIQQKVRSQKCPITYRQIVYFLYLTVIIIFFLSLFFTKYKICLSFSSHKANPCHNSTITSFQISIVLQTENVFPIERKIFRQRPNTENVGTAFLFYANVPGSASGLHMLKLS